MRRPRPVPAGRLRPTGRSPPRRRHRPSPPAVRAAAPIADRDAAPAGGAGPGRSSVPGPGGWTRPPTGARGQPRTLAAARTGKMQTRAWVISLVVGGVENLRPPHGPCPPHPPSSEHLLSDFDAALIAGLLVGRDELCKVVMEWVRMREGRRPQLIVGGVGTG